MLNGLLKGYRLCLLLIPLDIIWGEEFVAYNAANYQMIDEMF